MTNSASLEAMSADLLALQAMVRALALVQVRRSPAAMNDLVQALCEETGRLSESLPIYDEVGRRRAAAAAAVVGAWVEDVRSEAKAA